MVIYVWILPKSYISKCGGSLILSFDSSAQLSTDVQSFLNTLVTFKMKLSLLVAFLVLQPLAFGVPLKECKSVRDSSSPSTAPILDLVVVRSLG
jgi:hypothetical protein